MNSSPDDLSPKTGARSQRLMPVITPATALPTSPFRSIGPEGHFAELRDDHLRHLVGRYLRILFKRKWLIATIAIAIFTLGGVRTLMMTPLYTASVRLQIDRDAMKVIEGGNVTPGEGSSFDFLRTQYELLQSRTMAERVASQLRLGEDATFLRPREFSIFAAVRSGLNAAPSLESSSTNGAGAERMAAAIILAHVAIRPVAGSRLVDIQYSDPDPSRAQRIANAYADAYIASNVDKRFEANVYAKTFLEDQLKQLKLRLEESERALLDFAGQAQIIEVSEKSPIAEANLSAANTALGVLISERIRNEQLWRQVDASEAINMPQLLSNAVIDGLRARRNALVTEYQEKLETFKPSYPLMVQIDQKLKEVDRQLAAEVRTIRASLKAAYESARRQEEQMRQRVEDLKGELLELQKRMISHSILKREVDTNRGLYNGLLQRFKEVDIASGVGAHNIFVVDRATLPAAPSSPQLSPALLLSLALGLGAGLATAVVLDRLDDRIHSAEEVEGLTGLPILGLIPRIGPGTTVEAEIVDIGSALAEAYRSLATALQFSTDRGLPKSIVITSSQPYEGKSITALAISRHFANMGLKVFLIDADLRNPSLHKKVGCGNSVGISDYLSGLCTPPEAIQVTDHANLAFMASGRLPPNAADLLGGPRLHSLLAVGLQVFDLIVIDGPPVMGLADAQLLSNAADATLFVVGAGQARAGLVRGGLKRMQLAGARVIGTVLTKVDLNAGGYGYGHDYSYGYGRRHLHGAPAKLSNAKTLQKSGQPDPPGRERS